MWEGVVKNYLFDGLHTGCTAYLKIYIFERAITSLSSKHGELADSIKTKSNIPYPLTNKLQLSNHCKFIINGGLKRKQISIK